MQLAELEIYGPSKACLNNNSPRKSAEYFSFQVLYIVQNSNIIAKRSGV